MHTCSPFHNPHGKGEEKPLWKGEEKKNHHKISTANMEFDAHRVLHPGELHALCRVGLVNVHTKK